VAAARVVVAPERREEVVLESLAIHRAESKLAPEPR
jgi:hypothetical protein